MHIKHTTLLFVLIASLFATSCLTDSEQDSTPSQYVVDLQLENVGNTRVTGEDTLQVTRVSFLQGSIALQAAEQDSVVLFSDVGVFDYQFPGGAVQRLLRGELESGTYNTMTYNIVKAETGDENVPDRFVDGEGEDQRYSMIISGAFNQSEFTYKSTQPFNYTFDLGSPVEIPEDDASLALAINFAVNRVFLEADSSGYLDPSDSTNFEEINSNIEASIELLPFN